jgi:Carbohydrate esterase 2 N-terminal/GDSL-like Lipase/Acylhydrolase family
MIRKKTLIPNHCKSSCFLLLFLLAAFCGTAAASTDTLRGSSLLPYGRYVVDQNSGLEMISSAVHFGFRFNGTSCQVYAHLNDPGEHSYLQYTLDGIYQKRIRVNGNQHQPVVITGLSKGRHIIWIYKATEATTGPIFIGKIVAHDIHALREPDLPLIEFIGNSITCGAAADPSEIPCGRGEYHDQHNAYYAYGPTVARNLHSNFILSSVSGIGIYRSWNTPNPSMPRVYEKTDFLENSTRNWDFSTYHPRIVSIALGTNDFSDGDHVHARPPFDSAVFVTGYINFVQQVKTKYPKARIALLSSPMLNGSKRELLQRCLATVKENIDKIYPSAKPVALYFFKPMKARGCGGHPNLEDHKILADELTPFFRKLMNNG